MDKVTIGVHGFQYDPACDDPKDNPFGNLYGLWKALTEPVSNFEGFGWYSYPIGAEHVWKAVLGGFWNRYYAAWSDAEKKAAPNFAEFFHQVHSIYPEVNVMCHSLGTKVVLDAIEKYGLPINKLVLMNGADEVRHVEDIHDMIECPVLNVYDEEDKVLSVLGRRFGGGDSNSEDVIGRWPVGERIPKADWEDWTPEFSDDHWDSYTDPRNWSKIRDFLK